MMDMQIVTIRYRTPDGVETIRIPDVDESDNIWDVIAVYSERTGIAWDNIIDEGNIIDVHVS